MASASPINPWGAAVASGTVAATQYVYVYPGDGVTALTYAQTGIGDSADLLVGGGFGTSDAGVSGAPFELLPRYWLTDSVAAAVHAYYAVGSSSAMVGPEVDAVMSAGRFAFTMNAQWVLEVGAAGVGVGSVNAILAPELVITDRVSVFTEIDPSIGLPTATNDTSVAVTLVPGVSAVIGAQKRWSAAVGVQVPVTAPEDWSAAGVVSALIGG